MMKKFILALSVPVFLFLLVCACGTQDEEKQPVARTATDSDGKKYSVVVDGDGFLTLGDRDFLAVCVTDENGNPGKNSDEEYVTRAEAFLHTLMIDDEVHTKFFRIKIPEGWTNESDELVKFKYKTATFTVNEREGYSVKECKKEIEELMSAIGEGKEEKVKLSFSDGVKINYGNRIAVYIFEAEGRTYFAKVTADEKMFTEMNFEEIINTIKFRKGE